MGFKGIILILLFAASAFGHDEFDSTLALKLFTESPSYNLAFKSTVAGKNLDYKPNVNHLWGVRLALFDWLSAGYGFKVDQQDKEKIKKGRTEYQDWRFDLNFKRFSVALNYQEYKGLYIENSSEADPTWQSGQPLLQFPKMTLHTGSVNFTYLWSPEDFSLIAANDQLERQSSSGGSLLLGMAISETEFANKGPIIPTAVRPMYGIDQNIEAGKFLVITAKVGYGYTQVIGDNGFLSGAFQLGGGQQRRIYRDSTTERSSWNVAGKADAMISTGYIGDRFFGGLRGYIDGTVYRTESMEISSILGAISIFFGGRI